jgi:hypothetical protein
VLTLTAAVARVLSELGLKHAHSTILQSQSVFQFPQA